MVASPVLAVALTRARGRWGVILDSRTCMSCVIGAVEQETRKQRGANF